MTVAQYLAALPADRRAALNAVRKAINDNLPDGSEINHRDFNSTRFRSIQKQRRNHRSEIAATRAKTSALICKHRVFGKCLSARADCTRSSIRG